MPPNLTSRAFVFFNTSNVLCTDNDIENPGPWGVEYNNSYTRIGSSFISLGNNTNSTNALITLTGTYAEVAGTQQKGDFDRAGIPNLLWRNTSTGQNVLWRKGTTSFVDACTNGIWPQTNTNWVISGTADFNGDANNDILWTQTGTSNVWLWTMQGPSLISTVAMPPLPDSTYGIAATGDFNGDGRTDLVLTNSATNQFTLWLMNGTNFLTNVVVSAPWPSGNSQIVGAGKFNGDGQRDILWRDNATGNNYVWKMSGTNYLLSSVTLSAEVDLNWHIVGVGDFNGDGVADIVWRDPTTGSNRIWLTSDPLGATYTNVALPSLTGASWTICGPK
ncbi:MAG TPA: VCBS repeat-containing protein [Candidatus Saccharimonadales bacterium]|nr:VCBS repeat-containing protein [Candidatus Saccharimonadales bacterium]